MSIRCLYLFPQRPMLSKEQLPANSPSENASIMTESSEPLREFINSLSSSTVKFISSGSCIR